VLIGIDNYSFHRQLGEVRPGECQVAGPQWSWDMTIDAALEAGADVVALETCFMTLSDCREVLSRPHEIVTMLSWGHPFGLEFGTSALAEEDARAWLRLAAELGQSRMRIVIAHPRLRDSSDGWHQARKSVPGLARLAEEALGLGIQLCIENHADVTAEQLAWILEEVGSPSLGVCFDTANALRVGEDPVEAVSTLARWVSVVHIKDIASGPWHKSSGPTSVPLGQGLIAVADVVSAMADTTDDCWYLVELGHLGPHHVDEAALVASDIDWLRTHLASPAPIVP
jgi:3-oxoisoapionate decarboxylase